MNKAILNLRIFIIFCALSLFILIFDYLHFLNIPKKFIYYFTNPISFGIFRSYQNVLKQFNFVFLMRSAAQENLALKDQIGQLISENARLRKDLSENSALLSQVRSIDPRTYNLIPARPIGLTRTLKIDKGEKDGVRSGQAVIFKDNYIGKVIQISEKSANIQLIRDPDSKVAVFSQGLEGKAKGVLTGQFGTEALMDKILHEEMIQIGDLVYSEGTEGFLPRGLILGRVTEVMDRQNEVFKQAKVKEVFDARDLDLVFVIGE